MREDVKEKVVEFIKNLEGVNLKAYVDPRGIITIGIGLARHYLNGIGIQIGDTCTSEQAENWLDKFLSSSVYPYVDFYQKRDRFGDEIYVSLCSLIYNVGHSNIGQSLFNALKNKNVQDLAKAFMLYNRSINTKGDFVVCEGLVNRRQKEIDNFIDCPF